MSEINWTERADELLAERRKYGEQKFSIVYLEDWDITALIDNRVAFERDPQWVELRNYLYGWDCRILAEASDATCGVMLCDAARHFVPRLAKEFHLLTVIPPMNQLLDALPPEIAESIRNDELARLPRHSLWGRVVVENGKPIGLHVDGKIVRQTIDKPWTEYDNESGSGSPAEKVVNVANFKDTEAYKLGYEAGERLVSFGIPNEAYAQDVEVARLHSFVEKFRAGFDDTEWEAYDGDKLPSDISTRVSVSVFLKFMGTECRDDDHLREIIPQAAKFWGLLIGFDPKSKVVRPLTGQERQYSRQPNFTKGFIDGMVHGLSRRPGQG
jgi:hypothetical protein